MSISNSNNPILNAQQNIDFQSFLDSAQNDSKFLYVKAGKIEQENAFSAIFTRRSVNIATSQALESEVLAKFGKDAANALAPTFSKMRRTNTQLTVGLARSILDAASRVKTYADPIRELQNSYGPVVAQWLGQVFDDMVRQEVPREKAQELTQKMADEMRRALEPIQAKVTELFEANAAWSKETKELFNQTLETYIVSNPETLEEKSTALAEFFNTIPQVINNQMGLGDIYGSLTDPAQKRDLLQMIALTGLTCGVAVHELMLEALPTLRAEQPSGALTTEKIYAALTHKACPGNFAGLSPQASSLELDKAVNDMLIGKIVQAELSQYDTDVLTDVNNFLSGGIPLETAFERALELHNEAQSSTVLDIAKTRIGQNIVFESSDYSILRGEEQLSSDFMTMGGAVKVNSKVVSTNPSMSFHGPDGDIVFVRSGKQTVQNFKNEQQLILTLSKLCKNNPEQYRRCLWTLTQSSPLQSAFKTITSFNNTGVKLNEHTPLNYDITLGEKGEVTITMKLPSGLGYIAHATHVIYPDGSSETLSFECKPGTVVDSLDALSRSQVTTLIDEAVKTHGLNRAEVEQSINQIAMSIERQTVGMRQLQQKALQTALTTFACMLHQDGFPAEHKAYMCNAALAMGLQRAGITSGDGNPVKIASPALRAPMEEHLKNHPEIDVGKTVCDGVKTMFFDTFFREIAKNIGHGPDGTMLVPGNSGTQYFTDSNRQTTYLPDGSRLSLKVDEAKDQLAAFVSNGTRTRFEALSESEKKRVGIILSMVHQLTTTPSQAALGPLGVDGRNETYLLDLRKLGVNPVKNFYLSFDDEGSLQMTNLMTSKDLVGFQVYQRDPVGMGKSNLSSSHGLQVTIPESTLESMTKIDWPNVKTFVRAHDDVNELREVRSGLPEPIRNLYEQFELTVFTGTDYSGA